MISDPLTNLFIWGNTKVGLHGLAYIFNLPSPRTCKPTEWCDLFCYARKNNFKIEYVKQQTEKRYRESLRGRFAKRAQEEIKRKNIKLIRIHSGGDFYSEEYIQKWVEIASVSKATRFFTTTRRVDYKDALSDLAKLSNVVLMESLDPSRDEPQMDFLLASTEDTFTPITMAERRIRRLFNSSRRCPRYCPTCKFACWHMPQDVIWPVH